MHTHLSPLAITIAEKETVGAIVLDSPSIRLALFDGLAHGSVKVCANRQVLARQARRKMSWVTSQCGMGLSSVGACRERRGGMPRP